MAPLKASKLNLWAGSGACVSKASWAIARGMKLNINIKSFLKRRKNSDANAVWTHLITASSGCEQKPDVNYCRKCFLIDSRKNASPRNASRQGCVGVEHAAVDAIERNDGNKKKDCLNKHLAFIPSPWLSFGATQRPKLRLLGGIFPILSLSSRSHASIKIFLFVRSGQGGTAKACRVCGMDDKI